jgi:hypothetical protein
LWATDRTMGVNLPDNCHLRNPNESEISVQQIKSALM